MPEPMGHWPTGRMLSAVARRIEREWNTHLDSWQLNHASLPVLFLLAAGPLSQRELARANGVTEQTMSRVLARLERSGYIVRQPHQADRRRHEVALTPAGRTVLGEAGDPRTAEEISVRGLEPDQVRQLRELLTLMLAEHPRETDDDDPTAPERMAARFSDRHGTAPSGADAALLQRLGRPAP